MDTKAKVPCTQDKHTQLSSFPELICYHCHPIKSLAAAKPTRLCWHTHYRLATCPLKNSTLMYLPSVCSSGFDHKRCTFGALYPCKHRCAHKQCNAKKVLGVAAPRPHPVRSQGVQPPTFFLLVHKIPTFSYLSIKCLLFPTFWPKKIVRFRIFCQKTLVVSTF